MTYSLPCAYRWFVNNTLYVYFFLPNPVFDMVSITTVQRTRSQSLVCDSHRKVGCFVTFQNLVPQLVKITSSKTLYKYVNLIKQKAGKLYLVYNCDGFIGFSSFLANSCLNLSCSNLW